MSRSPKPTGQDHTLVLAAAALSRARARDVPTYAPSAFAHALSSWKSMQKEAAANGGSARIRTGLEQTLADLREASDRAAQSRQTLGDLVRTRTDMWRSSLERHHAPEILYEANRRCRLAIQAAESGDDEMAGKHAASARELYQEATIQSLERGPVARVSAAVADARLSASRGQVTEAERELAAVREVVADARRGEASVSALKARIVRGRRVIGSHVGLDPDVILTDPGPFPGGGGVNPGISGPPDPPLTIRVTERTEDSLTITWRDRSGLDEVNKLLRQEEDGPWEVVAEFGPLTGWTTHTDSALQPETRYCYKVWAENDQGVRTTPNDKRACGYTRDGSGIGVWRAQLRVRTADVSDAGTDDAVEVRLTSPIPAYSPTANAFWLDYGPRFEPEGSPFGFWRDDFARDRDFTYDLDLTSVRELSDITMLTIKKEGSDALGIAEIALLVNEVEVFNRFFGESSSSCLWIDDGDGHSPMYTIFLPELRAHELWQAYAASEPIPPFRIRNVDFVSRLESLIGHAIHGTDLRWGEFSSPDWVEAKHKDAETLAVDLDLEARAPIVEDPEIDLNFDLRFAITCNQAEGTATLRVTSDNFDASVDFDLLTELLGTALIGGGGVALVEDLIARKIEEGFRPITQKIKVPAGGLCPTVTIAENGDIVFDLA